MQPEVIDGKVQQPGLGDIAQIRHPVNRRQRREMKRHPERFLEPLKRGGVVVAYPTGGNPEPAFIESLTGLLIYDASTAKRIIGERGGGTMQVQGGPRVAETRTQIVTTFLSDMKFAGADYLLMVDDDMVIPADTVETLVNDAEMNDADVVGALCFAGGRATMFPTVYALERDGDGKIGTTPFVDYPRDTVVQVGATGTGVMLIRRSILVRLLADHPNGYGTLETGELNPYPWFVEGHTFGGNKPLGEDIAFCIRVNAVGGKILVDTRVKCGHIKRWEMNEQAWDELRAIDPGLPVVELEAEPDADA